MTTAAFALALASMAATFGLVAWMASQPLAAVGFAVAGVALLAFALWAPESDR
jgi:Flp pilus assembly protein TadB